MKRQEQFNDTLNRLFLPPNAGEMGINSPHSKNITFQVTEDCNLRCTYCYQGCKSHRKMSFETARRVIDTLLAADARTNQYISCDKISGVILDFIGGEPLLEVDLIDRILGYWTYKTFVLHHPLATRWRASISSNGTLYFEPKVQDFLRKWHRHLAFSISIDGNERLHDACRVFPDGSGSYAIAMRAAKDWMQKTGSIGSKMTIAPGNVAYLHEAVSDLLNAGYSSLHLNCVYEEGWTTEHARTLYQQMKLLADDLLKREDPPFVSLFDEQIGHPMQSRDDRNWCGGCGLMLAVDYKGDFYPCLRYMGSSLNGEQEPYTIGDLKHGIMNTEVHRARVRELEGITRHSQSTEQCWNCPIASGCAWCSAYNYQKFGTPNHRATYICEMHKARVLANAYYWNRRYVRQGREKRYAVHVPREWAEPIIGAAEYDELLLAAGR